MNYSRVQWEDMCYRGTLSLWVTGAGRLSILTLRKQPCLVAQDSWLLYRAKFIPSHPHINNASSQRMKNNCHHQGQQIFPLQLWHYVSTDLSLSLLLLILLLHLLFSFFEQYIVLETCQPPFSAVWPSALQQPFLNVLICRSHCISLCNIWVTLAAICFYLPRLSCGRSSATQAEYRHMKFRK